MKRKVFALLLTVLMLAALFAGCQKKTDDAFTLTVGFDAGFPPYGFINDKGDYDGFDLAMAAELCERLGWELKLQPIDWDAKDQELKNGTINCIWNGFTINGREEQYTWTEPYVDNTQVMVVRADSGITNFEGLSGKIVMTQKGSSALSALESEDCAALTASFSELLEVDTYTAGFMELEVGAVDALAIDLGVANYQISTRGDAYVILDEPFATEQYGVGFLLGNTELRDSVEAELKAMAADGTMLEIAKKYEDKGIVIESLCMIK